MVQEDHIQMCSISRSGGGSKLSSKKLKHKKVPQRGLGVAQLEKIRIEEEQKKDASNIINITSSSTTLSPTHSSTVHTISFPNYKQNNQSKPSTPFHARSPPSNRSSLNHIFRTHSTSNFDSFQLGYTPQMHCTNGGGFDIGWSLIQTHGDVDVSLPMLWHPYDFNRDKRGDNSRFDNHGLSFRSSFNLPYESCPIGPLPDVTPRTHHCHQSSMVNMSSMNTSSSSSSSSVLTFPIEPTSSKSYYSNYSSWWLDEEKIMVGMKRPCPIPFDNPPIPNFHGKFAPSAIHPISRSDVTASCGNGATTLYYEPVIPILREVPLCPSQMPEPIKKSIRSENDNSNEEFLTLAPPATVSSFPNSRYKQTTSLLASHNREIYNFQSLPHQGCIEDLVIGSGQVGSSQQPKFFSFFPTTKVQRASASSATRHHSCNHEIRENIDLNLRL